MNKIVPTPMTEEERQALRDQLQRQDVAPFRELLIDALAQRPSAEDWRRLASSAPDKYTKAVKQIGGLTGFTEKVVIEATHKHLIENMSDLELIRYIREQNKAHPILLEAQAVPVEGEARSTGPAAHGPSQQDLRDAGIRIKEK